MEKIGLLVNPIAGTGSVLGLKGTDYYPVDLYVYPGPAYKKAILFLKEFYKLYTTEKNVIEPFKFVVPNGYMGENIFYEYDFKLGYDVIDVYDRLPTTKQYTRITVKKLEDIGVSTIFFVGGDGTAYDVVKEIKSNIPVVGVPAGTKVYSSIFATSLMAAARLLMGFLKKQTIIKEAEIVLVDERALEQDVFKIIDVVPALTLEHKYSVLHQSTKDFTSYMDEQDNIDEIAEFFHETLYQKDKLYVFGPGTTVKKIVEKLGFIKPLFSFTTIKNDKMYCMNCSSQEIYDLVQSNAKKTMIVISPLGNTGFLIGRGTGVLTKNVLRSLGLNQFIVVATRRKAGKLRKLYVDTGDEKLNKKFTGYIRVIIGYNEYIVKKVIGLS